MADRKDGLRRATTFFRVFNFELYAKPVRPGFNQKTPINYCLLSDYPPSYQNKKVMVFGTACITGCVVFLLFLNFTNDRTRSTAQLESSSSRKTRWER